MENLRDKMLKAIQEISCAKVNLTIPVSFEREIAEACARVAMRHISKAFDAGEKFAHDSCDDWTYSRLDSDRAPNKNKYLKSLK